MKNSIKISILGGDRRQLAVIRKLAPVYDNINIWGIDPCEYDGADRVHFCRDIDEALLGADVVILPLPASSDGIHLNCPLSGDAEKPKFSRIISKLSRESNVIGGRLPDSFITAAEQKGIRVEDYFKSEDFQIKNAYTTAEAALSIAMNRLDRNIRGARIAVTGYGRIAKHLCFILDALGADITVAARRDSDLSWAQSRGCKTLKIDEKHGNLDALKRGYDVIYNTVPKWLFDRDFLLDLDKRTFIVDLASAPGGVDICAAKELGANVSWATSLPGKYAPASAGELIADCVFALVGEVTG